MVDLYLELYREKVPDGFASLPGADHVDPEKENQYWAVLVGAPAAGSAEADFIAPVGPDSEVGATTHGTDTLASGVTQFVPGQVCIWQPKEPPYWFHVLSPTGSEIDLEPPDGGDEHIWQCDTAPRVNGIGIWVIEVEPRHAADLPQAIGNRHACLNPADLDFDATHFEHQPLLRITGDEEPEGTCAELTGLEVTSGCAPGEVVFQASIDNIEDVLEIAWNFGDDTPPIVGGATETHTYDENLPDGAPLPDILIATVAVSRYEHCVPVSQPLAVIVPRCPDRCPNLTDVAIISDQECAPGTVQFRVTVVNAEGVESITWNFDDEDGDIEVESITWNFDNPDDDTEGNTTIEHTFDERRTYDVTVAVLLPDYCQDGSRIQLLEIEVPPCVVCPEVTGIAVTGCIHADGPSTVTLQAQGTDLGLIADFTWSFGDGTTTIDGPQVTHTYQDDQERDVSVSIQGPRECGGEQIVPARVTRCPDEIDWCLIWWWIMLVCIVGAAICAVIAACLYVAPPLPANPFFWIFLWIAIGLAVAGLVILIVWLILCARSNCALLLWLVSILVVLAGLAGVLTIILGVAGNICAAGALVDFFYLGGLATIAYFTAKCVGCLLNQDGQVQCWP